MYCGTVSRQGVGKYTFFKSCISNGTFCDHSEWGLSIKYENFYFAGFISERQTKLQKNLILELHPSNVIFLLWRCRGGLFVLGSE